MPVVDPYRKKILSRQEKFTREQRIIFDRVARSIANLINKPEIRFTKGSMNFPPYIRREITKIITVFHDDTLKLMEDYTTEAWQISNTKNDAIVSNYLKVLGKATGVEAGQYFLKNTSALEGFLSGKHGTETLSESVWKVARQLRGEMEIHLGLGITNGDSADKISQRIRQYLNNPEALFRRVRDKETGRLMASRAMAAYHPGQGIYRSAYKNAVRVARSTTNMAYLMSDHIRWGQMDMVIGKRISLSASHPDYNFPEICELCEGDYPKDFIWTGWHPQCLCNQTPILSDEKDFLKYLETGKKTPPKMITKYPSEFVRFAKNNYEKFSGYKSVPFWLEDNKELIEEMIK